MSFLSLGLQNDEQQKQEEEVLRGNPAPSSPVVAQIDSEDPASSDEVSVLPLAVEELRKKIFGNGYNPTFRKVINDGTPTFATFKFGYLPGRGLLYSIIGHEV